MTDSRERRPSAGTVWATAMACGLAGGLVEAAVVAVQKLWFKPTLIVTPHAVWMIPVVSAVLCAGVALGFSGVAWLRPARSMSYRTILFCCALVGCLGPLFALPRLHPVAVLLLAVGCAVQLTRSLVNRPAYLRNALVWLIGAVCLGAVVVNGARAVTERRAVNALPAAAPRAANVVLVVLDTTRAASLSLYGYPRATSPELQRIAATGTTFTEAFSTSPWTLPSHSSMFTGRWPHELSSSWRTGLDATYPTLAERLQARGYMTAGFVANIGYGSRAHGLNRGFIHYEDLPVSAGEAVLSSSVGAIVATENHVRRVLGYHRVLSRKTATQVTDDVLAWTAPHRDRPFFAFANYMDAHEPYLPPPPYDAMFGAPRHIQRLAHSTTDAFHPNMWMLPKEALQGEADAYDGAIAYLDHQVGRLVDGLRQQGLLDNTLLIIVADHGEHRGEHRLYGHGNSMYRPVLQVPLVLSFPGHVPAGLTVDAPVTLRDLPATVLDLLGEPQATMPGASLAACWSAADATRTCERSAVMSEASQRDFGVVQPWYPLSQGDMQSVVADGYHYIRNTTGGEELYDISRDRAEEHDLASDHELVGVLQRLRVLAPSVPPRSQPAP